MTPLEQRRAIRRHYGLSRPVTEEERIAEIAMLRRKESRGSLDDRTEALYAALRLHEGEP